MSANYPPPQSGGQNPYGQQPGGNPYGQQQGAPYGAPPAPAFNGPAGYPAGTAATVQGRDNVGLGVVAGVATAVVAALIYGLLIKGTKHEIGYAALGVGALVGLALGKVGGRNPALPVIGIPLALLGVYLGQMFGIALLVSDIPGAPGVVNLFTQHYSVLQDGWKHAMGGKDILFYAIAGLEGFVIAKRVAN